jgi:inhibitor of cysteine peptidase
MSYQWSDQRKLTMLPRARVSQQRRSGICEILILVLLILMGCSAANSLGRRREMPQMSNVTLTQADNGKSVEVKLGDTIVIELDENPTTGFRWAMDQTYDQIVTIVRDDYTTTDSGIGGGGRRTFTLKATHSGTVQFQLKLWRTWEGESSILERFTVTIQVRG